MADTIPDVMVPDTMAVEAAVRDIMAQDITEADIIDNGNRKEQRQPQGSGRFFRFVCWWKMGGHDSISGRFKHSAAVIFRQFSTGKSPEQHVYTKRKDKG